MFGFFKNKAYDITISTMKSDMNRFIEMLKGILKGTLNGALKGILKGITITITVT